MTAMVTVGVSIPVPAPWGAQLQGARSDYGDPLAPYVPAHITLLGPTEVDADQRPDFLAHLDRAARAVSPFRVVLRGTGTFRPVSQVVFVQVAEGISACERLEAAIRTGRYGDPLRFPYHPHVTVAHDVPEPELDRAFTELADFTCAFHVDAVRLYERRDDGLWCAARDVRLGEGMPGS